MHNDFIYLLLFNGITDTMYDFSSSTQQTNWQTGKTIMISLTFHKVIDSSR